MITRPPHDPRGALGLYLPRCSEAHILVPTADDVPKVHEIIKGISEFEAEYTPDNFVQNYGGIGAVNTGKFDSMDMNTVLRRCWRKGIYAALIVTRWGPEPSPRPED